MVVHIFSHIVTTEKKNPCTLPKFKLQLLKLPKGKCHLQDNPYVDGSNNKTVLYIYIYMFGLIINFFHYKLYCTYIKNVYK